MRLKICSLIFLYCCSLRTNANYFNTKNWDRQGDIYAESQKDRRYGNTTFSVVLREGVKHKTFRLRRFYSYLSLRFNDDTLTQKTNEQLIYNDNYLLASLGTRYWVIQNSLFSFLELGIGRNYNQNHARHSGDVRGGFIYNDNILGPKLIASKKFPFLTFNETYSDLIYFNRLQNNIIFTFQSRFGVEIYQPFEKSSIGAFFAPFITADTRNEFWNNAIEARFGAFAKMNYFSLYAYSAQARYLRNPNNNSNPYGQRYHDERILMVGNYYW